MIEPRQPQDRRKSPTTANVGASATPEQAAAQQSDSASSRERKIDIQKIRQPAGAQVSRLRDMFEAPGPYGSATLSIPIPVTATRGFEPELTLAYESSAGNGLFGQGMKVALSSISRATNLHLPRYDGTDSFTLDGALLVPVNAAPKTRSVAGCVYTITCYRPRIEQSFQRIEYWRPATGGPGFWRTLSRDDDIAIFGRAPEARIADPGDSSRVFEWLIEAQFDPRGEAIRYHYKAEDDAGVPVTDPERGRTHNANRYPARISYGNVAPFAPADPLTLPDGPFLFEVLFDYGEYRVEPGNDTPATPVRPWACRADSFSNYTAGFECRTHRLCRHILIVHHFRQELGTDDAVVKVMALDYDETPYLARLESVRIEGWRYQENHPAGGRYSVKTLPPLSLQWIEIPKVPPAFTKLGIAPGTGLPRFGEPPPYALVDLDGCGLPGVLYADGATTAYVAPALVSANVNAPVIYGSTPLPAFPIERISSDGVALSDLDGTGRLSLSILTPPLAGFFPRAEDGSWQRFRAYPFTLTDSLAQQVDFVDLTGDGRGDRLRVCSNELAYNPNLGELGFGGLQRRERAEGLPLTPPVPDADLRYSDVLGGGTVPAVWLRSGSLRCWPNLGYGRFGTHIKLAAPALPPNVARDRVILVDLTGDGYDDFVIALTDRLLIHRNQSGNRFTTDAIEVTLPAPLRSMSQLRSADMAGMGYQALVFTSDDPQPQHWVCDITGGQRPGLVAAIDDGQGCVVRIAYASSARFQLLDRLQGVPWITTLADPVLVVASIEYVDEVGGVTRIKDYRYSHGYFDPIDREFRGFGLIETRERDAPRPTVAQSVGDAPPLLVREWYHTGAMPNGESIEEAFAREYWHGDDRAFPMPPSCFDWGQISPDAETWRQAVAALAGTLLRRESFADGDPAAPFAVDASNALVRLQQPRSGEQAAVFLVTPREQVTSLYDYAAADPRITHDVTLEINAWGDVVLSCQVAYARRAGGRDIIPEQRRTWLNAARDDFMPVRQGPDLWLAGLPWQERRWSLPKPPAPTVRELYYDFHTLHDAVVSAIGPGGNAELSEWSRTVYVAEGGGEAPPGPVAAQALVVREEIASFDPVELAAQFCGAEPPGGLDAFLIAQGYRFDRDNGLWWNPGLTQDFAGVEDFFLPAGTRDPFAVGSGDRAGTVVTYAYDPHRLVIVSATTTSARGEVLPHVTVALAVDYHTVTATSVRDANQKVHEVLVDPLGDIIATSIYGWEWRAGAAVRTGFAPLPLNDPGQWPVPPDTGYLVEHASDYLGGAASFHFNDWHSWKRERQPTHAAAVTARDYPHHQSALPDITIEFIDGFGRPLQIKALTEPGTAFRADGTVNADAAQRWATTGGRHYNGLGLPDRLYEPYFTDHWNYSAEPGLNSLGVTLVLRYDAAGRPIRTDYPKGGMAAAFFSLIVYAPWSRAHWDRDDTVKASNYYRAHIDPGHEPLPPWERDALVKAAVFDGTPRIDHLDARGLIVREEQRLTQAGAPVSSLVTLHEYDADGMEIAQADPLRAAAGVWNVRSAYDLAGEAVRSDSVDAHTHWLLHDALGNPAYTHDSRGTSTIVDHDGYHRPTATRVWTAGVQTPVVAERFIYGDSLDSAGAPPLPEPDRRNLMGELCVTFDGAGRTDSDACALSGPVTDQRMRLALNVRVIPDWAAVPMPTWAALFAALDTKLQSEPLRITGRFNALGDIAERAEPNGTTVQWRYQRPGLLGGIAAARDGEAPRDYLAAVEYNAKSQRVSAQLKNADGALMATEYRYDPDTFLLSGITTTRSADGVRLQDLTYWTDPVGNVTHVADAAAPAAQIFHANQEVTPDQDFTYDSTYRLIANKGRAHVAYTLAMARDGGYGPYFPPPSRRDFTALERYGMTYDYDDAGNLWRTHYQASNQWTQTLTMAPNSNRGAPTEGSLEGWFDHNGNQLKLGGGPTMAWTWADCLAAVTLVEREDGGADAEYYCYDAAGMRKRRVTRRSTAGGVQVDETITMGDFAMHRRRRGEAIVEEWSSTRIADDDELIVELFDWITGTPPEGVATRQDRYQLSNLIGSSVMEVSREGRIITYEEYAPYGITVYAAGASLAEVSLKRFRFAGRSRDHATGLYYYGARYYAPWLGRWLSPDPAGDVDGLNLYAFVGGNPVSHIDIGGFARSQPKKKAKTASKRAQASKKKLSTPKKTTRKTKSGGKVTKPRKSKTGLGRGTFNAAAKAKMEPGTDLAHRTSFDALREDIESLRGGTITGDAWKEITTSIVGTGDADLLKEIDDFSKQTAISDDTAQKMLNRLNSAVENLRPGDPSLNRRIKARYDPGTEVSRGRMSTRDPTKRARSVSPVTRVQVTTRLKRGGKISFYVPDKKIILASTYKTGMDVEDFEASITPSLNLSAGQKLVATFSDKRGKVRTYHIQ